ncbi:hypothetical protein [Polaribacter sp. MED152]|uniref:hypothetical protein n=1 Tax=Polaribacter sp. MED152 TaxID=313598 RepID=UPI0002C4E8A4|nr:hypothetical protein [Polaribacter sp. MED152]EAQ43025.2 hypothetical protein MED152_09885 [Polaribacter sp. MED152]
MKTVKLLAVLLVVTTLLSCSEEDDNCREECYEIILVENGSRDCSAYPSCNYDFKVTFKNTCTNQLVLKRTRFISLSQRPKQGELVCNDFFGYR